MATGEVIGCFGLTEPDFGSNPSGMITMAQRADGRHVAAQRRQDVDHERIDGADRGRLGEDERRHERLVDSRLRRPDRQQGLQGEGSEGQALAARERHE